MASKVFVVAVDMPSDEHVAPDEALMREVLGELDIEEVVVEALQKHGYQSVVLPDDELVNYAKMTVGDVHKEHLLRSISILQNHRKTLLGRVATHDVASALGDVMPILFKNLTT